MESLKNIIESLLFVADTPLSLDRLKDVLELEDTKDIQSALEQLSREYEDRQAGIFLSEVAGGYQIRTKPEYHEYVKRLLKPNPHRLSNAALETLAIIAYKQPVIRSDIEHLRGVDCGGVLRVLMDKKLVRVLGRKEIPGRPLIYATTKHFLEVFELKNLKDLPSPQEIERHGDTPQQQLTFAEIPKSDLPQKETPALPAQTPAPSEDESETTATEQASTPPEDESEPAISTQATTSPGDESAPVPASDTNLDTASDENNEKKLDLDGK